MERRIAQVRISQGIITNLFTPGELVRVSEGLPEDATYLGATLDVERNCIRLFFASPSFGEVPVGEIPPEITVIFSRT